MYISTNKVFVMFRNNTINHDELQSQLNTVMITFMNLLISLIMNELPVLILVISVTLPTAFFYTDVLKVTDYE